ncbi:ATP/GTP-binding protein [Streptomyces sp. NPDC091290]|uniref:ATP/GTP-binding protein n=1 Tax=Streptomyces sp. NPDC091290 TaxID=3365990 RepID=UPI003814BC61
MSDDTDSNVINLPARGGDSGEMPDAPDGGDLFYSEPSDSRSGGIVPPESPEETTMELPPIRIPISPETALRELGMPDVADSGDEEYEEGGYAQPRSLADRLGDWLELRIEMARDRHAAEAPFREAEVARKAGLLEARTAQEMAMIEQNSRLHTAQMKAKAEKAAARGKADAARSSSSGLGADKGGRSKAGGGGSRAGGGSSGASPRSGTGGGRGSATNSSGRGSAAKSAGKGSDRSAGGRGRGSRGSEASGGSRGRQNGSGSTRKSGASKGSSGGSGKGSSGGSSSGKGNAKGEGGGKQKQHSPASSSRAERARGRQERAAARQAARQQRRGDDQAARIADRTKDRDQGRANRQAAWEERRAARQKKRAAAKDAEGRTSLSAAVREEAQRRWDERRRKAETDRQTNAKPSPHKAAENSGGTKFDKKETPKRSVNDPKNGRLPAGVVIDPHKPGDRPWKSRPPEGEANRGATSAKKTPGPSAQEKAAPPTSGAGHKPDADSKNAKAGGPGGRNAKDSQSRSAKEEAKPAGEGHSRGRWQDLLGDYDDRRREYIRDFLYGRRGRKEKTQEGRGRPGKRRGTVPQEPAGRVRAEDLGITIERADRPDASEQPRRRAHGPSPGTAQDLKSLPAAPEPQTPHPPTSRPTAQEDPLASEVWKPTSSQAGLAAQHRTDITFDEYLMEIVNIAIAAALDKDRAQELALALGKVADALRDMAADLINDHNIEADLVNQIINLADAAARMKQLAERCAAECEIASEAARIAASAVGRVYGEDIQAMDDAGLTHASAAAHHD